MLPERMEMKIVISISFLVFIVGFAAGFGAGYYTYKIPPPIKPPTPIYQEVAKVPKLSKILSPKETWDVFAKELKRYPEGNRLDLSYKANASVAYTVSFGPHVVSRGRCEESELDIKFSIELKAEFKVIFENYSDRAIEVSVEITVSIDPDC